MVDKVANSPLKEPEVLNILCESVLCKTAFYKPLCLNWIKLLQVTKMCMKINSLEVRVSRHSMKRKCLWLNLLLCSMSLCSWTWRCISTFASLVQKLVVRVIQIFNVNLIIVHSHGCKWACHFLLHLWPDITSHSQHMSCVKWCLWNFGVLLKKDYFLKLI